MDGRDHLTSGEGMLRHIAVARRDLRELEEDLAALECSMGPRPAGWPRLPRGFPRKVEVAGEALLALARELRGFPQHGAPDGPAGVG